MKKMTVNRAQQRRMNHYPAWKYLVLLVAVVLLGVSALPTWYGDQPAIQIKTSSKSEALPTLTAVNDYLQQHDISVEKITQHDQQTVIVLSDETEQSKARKALNEFIGDDDTITYSYVSMAPDWLTELGFQPMKFGLDLRGGVQFLLNVDVDQAFAEQREAMVDNIRQTVREERLRGVRISETGQFGVQVKATKAENLAPITQFIQQSYPNWKVTHHSDRIDMLPSEQAKADFQRQTVQQNLKIMRGRIEELGITEALVQRQGEHGIRIELPGVQDPSQAKNVIGATASLAFYEVKTGSGPSVGRDLTLLDEQGKPVVLVNKPILSGEHITNARAELGEMGRAQVSISLDLAAGKIMSDFSGKHIGKPMATVYREYHANEEGKAQRSEKVISVATIQSQLGTQFRITGAGTIDEAQQLALLLRAGSLTAPVTIVEERTIGASLGAENIQNGFAALVLGMGLTLTFMAMWYRRLGWVANVALLSNMICLLGAMSLIPGAVLTLPGIAGLVLTVGMAVDTNVLIFERIRDKLAEGRSFAQSIDLGFNSALSTILDANITTMITAVILYSIGNGPIQGFALTLGLGLVTSMFTGIFISRAIINLIWGRDARCGVRV
ncbi:protein translocase subunit SecD [Vibrio sp. Of7-15]|uniref:protein translocase subunit SecD n=1 Tax=Vibrio sp. Of7-15 TaxID=2724879 RepID=UPI001EF229F1|nr:protein translocase subunit SecD [Vibrio sp. Of7-15]MCG7499622.1 protein translocase subunit SecD [Vibrio sp. Of7-15]